MYRPAPHVAWHVAHAVTLVMLSWYVPAPHTAHVGVVVAVHEPVRCVPALHTAVHAAQLLSPETLAYVPATHALQALCPLDPVNMPAPHATQLVPPVLAWNSPAGHGKQAPAGAALPDTLLNVPKVQLVHALFDVVVGAVDSYCPTLHAASAAQASVVPVAEQLPVRYSVVDEHAGTTHGVHWMSAAAVHNAER